MENPIPGGRERRKCERRKEIDNRKMERRADTKCVSPVKIQEVIAAGRPIRSPQSADRRVKDRRYGSDRRNTVTSDVKYAQGIIPLS